MAQTHGCELYHAPFDVRLPPLRPATEVGGDALFAKPDYYRADESIPVELLSGPAAGAVVDLAAVFA